MTRREQAADDPLSRLDHLENDGPDWLWDTEEEFPPTKTWHVVLAVVAGLVLGCVVGGLAWVAFAGLLT